MENNPLDLIFSIIKKLVLLAIAGFIAVSLFLTIKEIILWNLI